MTNPTSNYSFQMPTSTDLVTDLPADFEVFGQAVDTRLKALQPGTTLGDLAYSSATANTNTRLPIGTNGQVLAVSGGVPAWTTTSDVTPLTTKGDLFTFTTVDARIGVGANGTVLTADSAEATGLKWATPAGGANWSLLNAGGTALTGASTITISGISGRDQIMVLVQNASTTATFASYGLRINGDTAANYDSFRVQSITYDSTYAASMGSTNTVLGATSFYNGSGGNTAAANYNGFWLISGCNSSGKKIYNGAGGAEGGTANQHITSAGVWNNTATVTSVSLISGANFDQGTIYVYATA